MSFVLKVPKRVSSSSSIMLHVRGEGGSSKLTRAWSWSPHDKDSCFHSQSRVKFCTENKSGSLAPQAKGKSKPLSHGILAWLICMDHRVRARVALSTEKRRAKLSIRQAPVRKAFSRAHYNVQEMSDRYYAWPSPAQKPKKPNTVFSFSFRFSLDARLLATPRVLRVHSAVRAARSKPRCKLLQKRRSGWHSSSSSRAAPRIAVRLGASTMGSRHPSSTP